MCGCGMESIYEELGGGHGIGGVLQRVSLYMEKILVIVCGVLRYWLWMKKQRDAL